MESPMLDNKNVEVTIRTSTSSSSNQFIPDNLELPDDTFRMSLDNFSMIGENVTIGRGLSIDSNVVGNNAYTPTIELRSPLPTPDLQTPDIDTRDIQTSGIETPDLQTPDVDSPDIQSPDIESTDGQTPDIQIPDIQTPEIDTPDIQIPDVNTPDLQTPSIDTPDIQTPDIDTPDIQTLDVYTPDLQTPSIDTPDAQTPDIDTPDIRAPGVDTPDLQTLGIETPDDQTPDIDTPGIQTPDVDSPDIQTPGIATPEVQYSDIESADGQTPDIETPEVPTSPAENKTSPPIEETPKPFETKTEIRRPQTLLKLSLSKKSDNDLFVKPSPVAELMSPARMLQFEVEATSATPTMKRAAIDFDFFSKHNFEEYFAELKPKEDKESEGPDVTTYKETPVIVKADTVRHEIGYERRGTSMSSTSAGPAASTGSSSFVGAVDGPRGGSSSDERLSIIDYLTIYLLIKYAM